MEDVFLNIHSYFRWVVLLAAVGALAFGLLAAAGSRRWDANSDRSSLAFTLAMDIQFLIGLVLWLAERRWEIADLVTWGHPVAMLIAVALAHIGRRRADAAATDKDKGIQASVFFGTSLLVVLAAIPYYSWPI